MKRSHIIFFVTVFALLIASFSSAISITSDTIVSNADYSGVTLQFPGSAKGIYTTLTAVNVLTAPLYIAGKDSGATATDSPVLFSYVSGNLRQSIEFASLLPSNSILSFTNLYAATPAKTSVFIFRSTSLLYNTTVNIYGITASWDTRDSSASLVEANTVFSIQERSAVYVTSPYVSKGAHVFSASLSSTLGIMNYGVLAIDSANCTSCSSSMVLIDALMYVSGNSMFRVSQSASGGNTLIDHEGDVTVTSNSLYFVSECTTSGGKLYAGSITLTTSAGGISTLRNITCGSTGYTSSSPIAFTYVYALTVGSTTMSSIDECLTNGVKVSSSNFFGAGVDCNMAQCIPGTTLSATHNTTSGKCVCNCQTNFNQLACTATVDPLSSLTTVTTGACTLANCKRCSSSRLGWCNECVCPYRLHNGVCTPSGTSEPNCASHYDNGFCKVCSSGYQRTDDYRCVTCTAPNCKQCFDNNLCSVCNSGFTAGTNGVCYST